VNLLRASTVRLFAVGLNSETRRTSVRNLVIPPQIHGINYYVNQSPSNLAATSGSVAAGVGVFKAASPATFSVLFLEITLKLSSISKNNIHSRQVVDATSRERERERERESFVLSGYIVFVCLFDSLCSSFFS